MFSNIYIRCIVSTRKINGALMRIIKNISDSQISDIKKLSAANKVAELVEYIENLPLIVKAELAVLVWKGRGDEITDDQYQIDYALAQVQDNPAFAHYLATKPLSAYL